MNNTSQNAPARSTGNARAARLELERALSLHFQGNRAGALKGLRKALELDPALAREPLTANLARELTGLAPAEALKNIADVKESQGMIASAQKEWQSTPQMRRQRFLLPVLAMLLLVLIGLFAWSVKDGSLQAFLAPRPQIEKANLGGYEYYVSVPRGHLPKGGWPMVVAFHGYGGEGSHMLGLAGKVNKAGAIFVAPTLGTYEPNPGNGPLEPVSRILTEIDKQHPLQARGAVLFGHSQGGSFAYRFSVYHSGQVAGVVTAGAPEIDPLFPARNIPYILTWGELDELHRFVLPTVYPLQSRGHNIRTAIIPGVGHEVSQYAIDQVFMLLDQP